MYISDKSIKKYSYHVIFTPKSLIAFIQFIEMPSPHSNILEYLKVPRSANSILKAHFVNNAPPLFYFFLYH